MKERAASEPRSRSNAGIFGLLGPNGAVVTCVALVAGVLLLTPEG
ncbi:MAG TPA: hypothetical protein VF591_17205 [Pyrinomonadaceae bacterium]